MSVLDFKASRVGYLICVAEAWMVYLSLRFKSVVTPANLLMDNIIYKIIFIQQNEKQLRLETTGTCVEQLWCKNSINLYIHSYCINLS